jgi:hypothetical protein
VSTARRTAGGGAPTPKPAQVSTNRRYPITPLPLAVSLKKALVFGGAAGHIPREHARQLLVLLGLQRGVSHAGQYF